jgi:hypothetical protein
MRWVLVTALLSASLAHADDDDPPHWISPREDAHARKARVARREVTAGQVLMLAGTGAAVVGAVITAIASQYSSPIETCPQHGQCPTNFAASDAFFAGVGIMAAGSFLVASGAIWLLIGRVHARPTDNIYADGKGLGVRF